MTWRLEPVPRSDGIEEGLAARVHDPLWLLARQWQFGEFHGQDAGTPAVVRAVGSSAPVDAWRGGAGDAWRPFDAHAVPLDALVEAETLVMPGLRDRIEAGAQFLRCLAAVGLERYGAAFVAACPLPGSDAGNSALTADALMRAVARRRPDGAALPPALDAITAGLPGAVAIAAADRADFDAAARSWRAWYDAEIAPSPLIGTAHTWNENHLEYAFSASSGGAGGTVLQAGAYPGDGIDWYDFDIDAAATAAPPTGAAEAIDRKAVPMPVRFGGMPLSRYWAMEDARYDFGATDASAGDIGRLLLVEFATVYGNDWFVLPIKLPAASLTALDTVVVTDTFGRNLLCGRAGVADPQWNLFSLDVLPGQGDHQGRRALLLPPGAAAPLEGHSVETVHFLRDETADLAFGVERVVEDALGGARDRRAAWQAPPAPRRNVDAPPVYRVETTVPDYWIPLAPEALPGQQSLHLRLVPLETLAGGAPSIALPQGRILSASAQNERLWIYEQDVPREGTRVDRVHRLARWSGGGTALWTARRRSIGTGEGSSGLRFDTLLVPDRIP